MGARERLTTSLDSQLLIGLRLVADLAFLKRCRDCRLIPSFVKISHHLWSPYTKHIFSQPCLSLLRSIIKSTRRAIDFLNSRLLPLHLELASSLRLDLWLHLDLTSFSRASGHKEECVKRKKKKFYTLQRRQHGSHSPSPSDFLYAASSIPHHSSPSLSSPPSIVTSPASFPFPLPPPSLSGDQIPFACVSCSSPSDIVFSSMHLLVAESVESAFHLFCGIQASIDSARGDLERSSTHPEDQENKAKTVVHHSQYPQTSINSVIVVVSRSSIRPIHSYPLHHYVKLPKDSANITMEIGDAATPLGTPTAITQPAKIQQLLSNGSSWSPHGTLSSSSIGQSHVFCFNCSAISCSCDCIACKLFQP
ncbi:hypothetical protein SUGI_0122410 [Cryptomeria japonica]|nr:hypothetical protein SUGI_0122410 [Cryptomeria japonica]